MSTRAYRPRRRIYNANYDIGESYYKKALDGLDNKRGSSVSRFSEARENLRDAKSMPKVSFANGSTYDDDEDFFKPKPRKPFNFSAFENSDADTSALVLKPYTPKIFLSHELHNDAEAKSSNLRHNIATRSQDISAEMKKSSFVADMEEEIQSFVPIRSKLAARTERIFSEDRELSTTAVEASSRMKATKARLADLESEMLSITEKQTEREKRNTRLRKLLNESDAIDALAITTKNISF